jgi:hypothetical protein
VNDPPIVPDETEIEAADSVKELAEGSVVATFCAVPDEAGAIERVVKVKLFAGKVVGTLPTMVDPAIMRAPRGAVIHGLGYSGSFIVSQ